MIVLVLTASARRKPLLHINPISDKGWKDAWSCYSNVESNHLKIRLKNSDTSKPVAESGQKIEPQHPVNKWQEEMNKASAKAES